MVDALGRARRKTKRSQGQYERGFGLVGRPFGLQKEIMERGMGLRSFNRCLYIVQIPRIGEMEFMQRFAQLSLW
jgi:hypothetical protein